MFLFPSSLSWCFFFESAVYTLQGYVPFHWKLLTCGKRRASFLLLCFTSLSATFFNIFLFITITQTIPIFNLGKCPCLSFFFFFSSPPPFRVISHCSCSFYRPDFFLFICALGILFLLVTFCRNVFHKTSLMMLSSRRLHQNSLAKSENS